jgi:NADPH2:quinone reductase
MDVRTAIVQAFGEPSQIIIDTVPGRAPGVGEVRIGVHATGVNFVEVVQVAGQYQIPLRLPFTPGFELSGQVLECGPGVNEVRPSDRVIAVATHGTYADEVVLPVANIVPIPERMDLLTAAAFPVAFATAHLCLVRRARLARGETLVVHGATGSVGAAAVQVGKRLGARVIAVTATPERVQGDPDHVVDRRAEDVAERVLELTGGRGADVIFDPVGGDAFAASLGCIAWEGRILTVGYASGIIPRIELLDVLVRNCAVIGEDLAGYVARDVGVVTRALAEVVNWYQEGSLHLVPPRVVPLVEAATALATVASGDAGGKLVLATGQPWP